MSDNPFVKQETIRKKTNIRCKFCKTIVALPDDKKQIFVDVMRGETRHNEQLIHAASILAVLDDWGLDVGGLNTLKYHRNGYDKSKRCQELINEGWGIYGED